VWVFILWPILALGDFAFRDDGTRLWIDDGGKPVLAYNYGKVQPPAELNLDASRWARSCYIHPVYGLDDDVLTQDFPPDHFHHRGIFWAWPYTSVGERRMDIWLHEDCEPRFEQWLSKEADGARASVELQNAWVFKDDPAPVVRETVRFTVHPADDRGRPIDFHLSFANVSNEPVKFLGAAGKGYGGFCVRPDATRVEPVITTALGRQDADVLKMTSPWADFSSRMAPGAAYSGCAVFQHPSNPGYPHPGWLLRYYGFRESFELRYRLYLHRGSADEAKLDEVFKLYEREMQDSSRP
jgi:hypothetical protein